MKEALAHALKKRKNELEIKISIEPKEDDGKESKELGMAPEVKDQDPSMKALNPKLQGEDDDAEKSEGIDKEMMMASDDEEEMSDEGRAQLLEKILGSETETGREPMTLAEKARSKMKAELMKMKGKRA